MIGGENYMEVIRNSEFGGERPLFESHNLRLENVIIRAGENGKSATVPESCRTFPYLITHDGGAKHPEAN